MCGLLVVVAVQLLLCFKYLMLACDSEFQERSSMTKSTNQMHQAQQGLAAVLRLQLSKGLSCCSSRQQVHIYARMIVQKFAASLAEVHLPLDKPPQILRQSWENSAANNCKQMEGVCTSTS